MALVVRAFPAHSRKAAEEFARELKERPEETRRFYTGFNVRSESWFVQETEHGTLVIGVTDIAGSVEKTAQAYQESDETFASWFKQRVCDISGVDPNVTPLGPPTEMIFEFHDHASRPA